MWLEKFYKSLAPIPVIFFSLYISLKEQELKLAQYSAEIMIGGSDPSKYVGNIIERFHVAPILNPYTDSILWTLRGSNVVINGDTTFRTMGTVNFDLSHPMINFPSRLVAEIVSAKCFDN